MRPPRVGLYASYVPCIEEGWTRFVFDEYGLEYTSIVDNDIREERLDTRFDCIILPHQLVRQLYRGLQPCSLFVEVLRWDWETEEWQR